MDRGSLEATLRVAMPILAAALLAACSSSAPPPAAPVVQTERPASRYGGDLSFKIVLHTSETKFSGKVLTYRFGCENVKAEPVEAEFGPGKDAHLTFTLPPHSQCPHSDVAFYMHITTAHDTATGEAQIVRERDGGYAIMMFDSRHRQKLCTSPPMSGYIDIYHAVHHYTLSVC